MKSNLKEIYTAGRVTRYHAEPILNLFCQTDADHTWGCLALLYLLNPAPSDALVRNVLWHDVGERWTGDSPGPAKHRYPELRDLLHKIETHALNEQGIVLPDLTEEEGKWLKLVDSLESHLWMTMHDPKAAQNEGFQNQWNAIVKLSEQLGVTEQIIPLTP